MGHEVTNEKDGGTNVSASVSALSHGQLLSNKNIVVVACFNGQCYAVCPWPSLQPRKPYVTLQCANMTYSVRKHAYNN